LYQNLLINWMKSECIGSWFFSRKPIVHTQQPDQTPNFSIFFLTYYQLKGSEPYMNLAAQRE
jgi:hypothetical protein